jgi:hypothetical protein
MQEATGSNPVFSTKKPAMHIAGFLLLQSLMVGVLFNALSISLLFQMQKTGKSPFSKSLN